MSYTWTPADYQALVQLAQSKGTDPAQSAMLFLEESGLNPTNPGPSGAGVGGLNQMSTSNLSSLGLTMAAWLAMSAATQLPYIFRFWSSLVAGDAGGVFPTDAGTLLALNFLPGAFKNVGAATNPNAVLCAAAGPYANYYTDNKSLDPGNTGTITPATCLQRLNNVAAASSYWNKTFLPTLQQYYTPGSPSSAPSGAPSTGSAIASSAATAILGGVALGGLAFVASETRWGRAILPWV